MRHFESAEVSVQAEAMKGSPAESRNTTVPDFDQQKVERRF